MCASNSNIAVVYGIVYCVTNKLNVMKYIGQTTQSLNVRRYFHENLSKRKLFYRFCARKITDL